MTDFRPGLEEALHGSRTGKAVGHGSRPCALCIVIDHAVPGEPREALISSAAGRISAKALRRSLQAVGVRLAEDTILNHRNEAHTP